MTDTAPQYRGRIDLAPDESLVGEITDAFGYRVILTGRRNPAGGFWLEGRVEIPKDSPYRLPLIDGEDE